MKPKRYKAKELGSDKWVEGWYVEYHTDTFHTETESYTLETTPAIYNDSKGHRDGCHWHKIDVSTLQEIAEERNLFSDLVD